jgi:hypothetical protein
MQREQKITRGEMRVSGPTRIIVYCADYKCGHSIVVDASRWSYDVRLSILSRDLLSGLRPSGGRHPAVVRARAHGDRLAFVRETGSWRAELLGQGTEGPLSGLA